MQIGIGHPGTIPGVNAQLILDWARRADTGPFSSLGSIDRLVYPSYDALITLSAAAAVTQRIRLITTVLQAPLHNAGLLAKQTASLDAFSGGRLSLGLGIGVREDDFRAAPADIRNRGKRFEQQLEIMKRAWSGQPLADDIGPIGPLPAQSGGPELLIGGVSPNAIQRVGRWGEGFLAAAFPVQMVRQQYDLAEQAWKDAGRPGKPRFVASTYWGFGPQAAERIVAYIGHYYAFAGPLAEQMVNAAPLTTEALKDRIQAFADIGVDELICWPCVPELEQVDLLAQLIG